MITLTSIRGASAQREAEQHAEVVGIHFQGDAIVYCCIKNLLLLLLYSGILVTVAVNPCKT